MLRLLGLILVLVPTVAHAGWLSMRGAYYKEKATRVIQPILDAEVDVGEADVVTGHLLVDSITSASAATGRSDGFTERRYEGGLGWRHDFGAFRLGGTYRYSTENDYTSHWGSARFELDLRDKNATVAVAVARGFDTITNGVAPGGIAPYREEKLRAGLSSLSFTQVLSPQLTGTLTFDFTDEHGFLSNIYRQVLGGPTPVSEQVPDLRLRAALAGSLRGFVCPTDTTLVASYRYYADDWGLHAHTGELRVIQALAPGVSLRGRLRLHVQDAADFFQTTYSAEDIMTHAYVVSDDKLSAFHAEELGFQLAVYLSWIGAEGWMGQNRVDLMVDHIWQDNEFGDAWAAQVGLVVPLEVIE